MERKKLITIIIAAAVIAAVYIPGHLERKELRDEYEIVQKRIEFLQQHNNILTEDVRRLKEDPDYVEKRAREKLGLVREGEIIYEG